MSLQLVPDLDPETENICTAWALRVGSNWIGINLIFRLKMRSSPVHGTSCLLTVRIKPTIVYEKYANLLQFNRCKPATCFGHLVRPSVERERDVFKKDVLQRPVPVAARSKV